MIRREDKEYYLEISTNLHGKALFVAAVLLLLIANQANTQTQETPGQEISGIYTAGSVSVVWESSATVILQGD